MLFIEKCHFIAYNLIILLAQRTFAFAQARQWHYPMLSSLVSFNVKREQLQILIQELK